MILIYINIRFLYIIYIIYKKYIYINIYMI